MRTAWRQLQGIVCAGLFLGEIGTVVDATIAPRKEKQLFDKPSPKATEKEKQGLTISDATEFKLDGKPCRYEDIPDTAEVILMEVAKDKQTVLKLHFRSKK